MGIVKKQIQRTLGPKGKALLRVIPHSASGLQGRTRANDNSSRRALQPVAAGIRPMKNTNKASLTQKAVQAMTDAVAKVVKDHLRRGRPLAVWRNGKAT
jgi:hypothetical protein